MQNHIPESRVAVVAMSSPPAGAQVHFDIPLARGRVVKLDERLAEIRAAFQIVKTRMKNAHHLTVQGFKLFAEQALMQPDGL
jgi:hypothetical protein